MTQAYAPRLARLLIPGVVSLVAACGAEQAGPAGYQTDLLIPGSEMHGVHGLAFDAAGELYGASLAGYSIYHIARDTGEVTTEVEPFSGNSDDLAFGPDGTLVWTAGAFSSIFARRPDGEIVTLASDLPGVNSVNFSPDGRLYITRVFGGDHLYEIDIEGVKPPQLVAQKLGGLNGFEVTADNKLYGPLFFKKKVVEVDLETGEVRDFADGFTTPAAVNIDQNGNLYVVDYATGEVTRIRMSDGDRSIVATLDPPLDNLAIDDRGWVYVSNPAFNRVTEINPESGATRVIVEGNLSLPGDIAIGRNGTGDALFIADFWGNRFADPDSGTLTMFPPPQGVTASASIAISDDYYAVSSIWPFGVVYVVERATNKLAKRVAVGAPYGMAFLEDGSLLVADYKNNQVLRLGAGKSRDKTVVVGNLNGPVGLAVDPRQGVVYVSEYGSGAIIRFPLSRALCTKDVEQECGKTERVMTNLDKPEGLATDNAGNLFFAETGTNTIWTIPVNGGEPSVIGNVTMGLAGGEDMPAPFIPTGVSVDRQNRIYVSSDIENAIYRLTLK
jgi:sugar lactone lactonase YvrE